MESKKHDITYYKTSKQNSRRKVSYGKKNSAFDKSIIYHLVKASDAKQSLGSKLSSGINPYVIANSVTYHLVKASSGGSGGIDIKPINVMDIEALRFIRNKNGKKIKKCKKQNRGRKGGVRDYYRVESRKSSK